MASEVPLCVGCDGMKKEFNVFKLNVNNTIQEVIQEVNALKKEKEDENFVCMLRNGVIPQRTNLNDGFDLISPTNIKIPGLSSVSIDIGISFVPPLGCTGFIFNKSSVIQRGIYAMAGILNPGLGHVILENRNPVIQIIEAGDSIAQLVWIYTSDATPVTSEEI